MAAYEDDLTSDGYINNSTRVWCWRPDVLASFQTLRAGLTDRSDLSDREVAVMVAATAAARGDPTAAVGCPACRALRRGDGGETAPRRPERPVEQGGCSRALVAPGGARLERADAS